MVLLFVCMSEEVSLLARSSPGFDGEILTGEILAGIQILLQSLENVLLCSEVSIRVKNLILVANDSSEHSRGLQLVGYLVIMRVVVDRAAHLYFDSIWLLFFFFL